ncbi:MAG: hypothetical protein M3292_04235 [Actinomycetota bacterium]|nr:hypothetical protein [Actinomycetota bacterium]
MLDIAVSEATSASPKQVLVAATDLSEERVKVWSNSKPRYFKVHDQRADFAEVTEGFRPPFGRVWERSRYEWKKPVLIHQTVIDSNVLEPGSTWELEISPSPGGGSTVEMRLRREFRASTKGRIASAINHVGGRRMWGWYLRKALRAVEKRAT